MVQDKTLPSDIDSDYSLPGRYEESNTGYVEDVVPKPKNKTVLVIVLVFVVFSVGVFSYYFVNQNEIDSKIIQSSFNLSPEKSLLERYSVGEFGSAHAHAAIAVFVDGNPINFGMPQFQLQSRYIHFEGNDPHIIHKHATNVPLEMLFASLGIKITPECIFFNYQQFSNLKNNEFCADNGQSLVFFVNGLKVSSISQYVIEHEDKILISFGKIDSIKDHLEYLDSLRIPDIPKKSPYFSQNEIRA